MKAQVSRADLANAAKWVVRAVSRNPQHPIMTTMAIRADAEGYVELTGFDYDLMLSQRVEALVTEPGVANVGGASFATLLGAMTGADLYLKTSETDLEVTAGRTRSSFPLASSADYPSLPQVSEETLLGHIPAEVLSNLAHGVGGLSMREVDAADMLWRASLMLEGDGQTLTVRAGTNYALARTSLPSDISTAQILAPAVQLATAARGLYGTLGLHHDGGTLGLQSETQTVILRTYDSKVPPLDRLLDTEMPEAATVLVADLQAALKLISSASDRVLLTFSADELTVTAHTPEKGEARHAVTSAVDCQATAEGAVAFSLNYLEPILEAVQGEAVTMGYTPGKATVTMTDGTSKFAIQGLRL